MSKEAELRAKIKNFDKPYEFWKKWIHKNGAKYNGKEYCLEEIWAFAEDYHQSKLNEVSEEDIGKYQREWSTKNLPNGNSFAQSRVSFVIYVLNKLKKG